jgi:RsiW-degrading membrane proteinase PrsW (M82 family)
MLYRNIHYFSFEETILSGLPPPPPPPKKLSNFHLPRTYFFLKIRAQLAELEKPAMFKSDLEVPMAFFIAFALGGILGIAYPLAVNTAFSAAFGDAASWATPLFIAPFLTEEISKGVCMLVVAFALVRVLPNRRYGAAIGAATGLGFAIMENLVFAVQGQTPGGFGLLRLINTPFTHPIFSSFVGIGVFVLVSRMRRGRSFFDAVLGLPMLFVLIGMINHSLWNLIAVFAPQPVNWFLGIILLAPIFLVILRDFLGGHFNFQHFFEPLSETSDSVLSGLPPPPPPPPPHARAFAAYRTKLQDGKN